MIELQLADIESALQRRGLKYWVKARYILSQCPMHDDHQPSAQIYLDDFFVNCHACGRFPPQVAFPELKQTGYSGHNTAQKDYKMQKGTKTQSTPLPADNSHYKPFDLYQYWLGLDELTDGIKTIPADILNEIGWRKNDGKQIHGQAGDIFIPYFNSNKNKIPFAQVRHMSGERRFTFLKDAKPTIYGSWNLSQDNSKIFVVEGTSDCATLHYVSIPWVGLPSSSSITIIKQLAEWCQKHEIELVYAGDKDEAGDKLKAALDEVGHPYRTYQVPNPYNDWAEFLEAEAFDRVFDYAAAEFWR